VKNGTLADVLGQLISVDRGIPEEQKDGLRQLLVAVRDSESSVGRPAALRQLLDALPEGSQTKSVFLLTNQAFLAPVTTAVGLDMGLILGDTRRTYAV